MGSTGPRSGGERGSNRCGSKMTASILNFTIRLNFRCPRCSNPALSAARGRTAGPRHEGLGFGSRYKRRKTQRSFQSRTSPFQRTPNNYSICWGFVPCRFADLGCWHSWKRRYVLQTVQMAYPDQASSPQGLCGVSRDPLVANDLGIGSGWQQSKQN